MGWDGMGMGVGGAVRGCGPSLSVHCGSPPAVPARSAARSCDAERWKRSADAAPQCGDSPGGVGGTDRSATKRSDRTGPPHRPTPPHFGPHSTARAEICLRGGAGPKSGRERRRCPAGCVRAWGAPVVPEVMELWGWEMSA